MLAFIFGLRARYLAWRARLLLRRPEFIAACVETGCSDPVVVINEGLVCIYVRGSSDDYVDLVRAVLHQGILPYGVWLRRRG